MSGETRYWRIAIVSVLMAAVVFTAGNMLLSGLGEPRQRLSGEGDTPSIASEGGVFRLAPRALEYQKSAAVKLGTRSLAVFYARRAFPARLR